jgi:hypothetical protein
MYLISKKFPSRINKASLVLNLVKEYELKFKLNFLRMLVTYKLVG